MESEEFYRQFTWNCVIVIESLPEEQRTGKELVNSVLGRRSLQNQFGCAYILVSCEKELIEVFELIKQEITENEIRPILHLEAHGSPEGIELISGELVGWDLIRYHLRMINVLTRNNLLIVLGICHGIEIWQQINVLFRAPFWGVIAPVKTVPRKAIEEGFIDFYEKLIEEELDLVPAISVLNQYEEDAAFQLVDAQKLFDNAWDAYRNEFNTADKVGLLIDYLVENKNIDPSINHQGLREKYITRFNKGEGAKADFFRFFMMLDLIDK